MQPKRLILLSIDSRSKRILRDLKRHPEKARKGSMKGLWAAGKFLQKETQKLIKDKSSKTGRTYKFKGKTHQASAAGEYPANRSGKLRKSVGFDVLDSEDMEFGYRDSVNYGKWLEDGTKKIKKRPALNRTVQDNKIKVLNIIGLEIEKEIIRT
jgi:HK97 gp10 family phage protein